MVDTEIYQPVIPRAVQEHTIRGVRYSVNVWGEPDAPLLIYLHGWGDTGSTFQFVADVLGAEWHIVAPDWRGFGRSHCDCSSYWFPDYLADLHELLELYSATQPARLIGHSMGANVAALYAGVMPNRVQAFVNVEGFGLVDSNPAEAPARYRDWLAQLGSGTRFSSYESFASLAARIRSRSPRMSEAAAEFVAREWASRGDDGVIRLRADPRHKLPNPVLYRRAEAAACWQATTANVLVVTGSRSRFADRFQSAAGSAYPDAETATIDGAGHMLHFETPRELAGAVSNFLQPTL